MKKTIYILSIFIAQLFVSCDDDFLDRPTLDAITEPLFWNSTSDLELFANSFYEDFPGWASVGNGFSELPDNNSDLSLYISGNTTYPKPTYNVTWNWVNVREANYFLSNVDKAEGLEIDLDHYKGEGYFFRAYYYYRLLRLYGDLPIYDTYFDNTNVEELFKSRDPRNEVVRFMLEDLDNAIELLKSKSELTTPRVSAEAAMVFKATVALYEGTWEKYHAGTEFGVDGSDGAEFLEIAATAAKSAIDSGQYQLHTDYESIFNQQDLSDNKEIMLYRQYDYLTFGTDYGNDLRNWPNNSGLTRFAVRSYLCDDGLPISVSSRYEGDERLTTIENNRDPRLAATVMVPGDALIVNTDGSIGLFEAPTITGNLAAVTGYESQKYRNVNVEEDGGFTRSTARIVMRYAEALLIYAEAKAELGTITQTDLDISINLLRDRVNMPHLTLASIVDDPDWPDYGYELSDVLQEIRRERVVELMNEGFRYDDLMRWRAHNIYAGKNPKGAYYSALLKSVALFQLVDEDNYLSPYKTSLSTGYVWDETRDYLENIPLDERTLNPNLEPNNPGYGNASF